MRALLEATYAESVEVEPQAWQELRDELEKRRQKLAGRALSATRIWTQPALPDEESVQTRHTDYPSAGLLLVRGVEALSGQSVRAQLLDGTRIEAGAREWSFHAAKAIHRNLVPVPRWVVASALPDAPAWLTQHVARPTALGLLRLDGEVHWPGGGFGTGLSYHAEQGIVIDRRAVPGRLPEDFDEPCD
jgi:hypothetical protein